VGRPRARSWPAYRSNRRSENAPAWVPSTIYTSCNLLCGPDYEFPPRAMLGRDEGAADIAVLIETFAVFDAKDLRHLQRAGAAGVGNRDDDVDIVFAALAQNLGRELLAHAHA